MNLRKRLEALALLLGSLEKGPLSSSDSLGLLVHSCCVTVHSRTFTSSIVLDTVALERR